MLVALTVLLVVAPLVHRYYAQQASRYTLSAAIWDDGTVSLDGYEGVLGIDHAVVDGRVYSDKAPAQPILGAPLYGAYRAVGGESAKVLRVERNLGLWWQTFWFAAVPAGLLAVLLRREAGERSAGPPWTATAAALAVGCGTLLLPFGALLFSHVLAATLGFAAHRLIWAEPAERWPKRAPIVGVLLAGAVAVEYTSVVLVAVLGTAAWVHHRRQVARVILGAAPVLIGLGWYLTTVFGGPLTTGYEYSATYGALHDTGILGFGLPTPSELGEVLVGERGVLVTTPVAGIGLVGLIALVRKRAASGAVTTALAVAFVFVLVHAGLGHDTWGDGPGPRHLVPALPFLTTGVAYAFERLRLLTAATALLSVTVMVAATITDPLLSIRTGHPRQWFDALADGRTIDSILTMWLGSWAILVPLFVALATGIAALRLSDPDPQAG